MTKQEVLTHPVFLRLSDGDQNFIRALIDNGNDKRSAALITWKCKDDASADAMANRALRKPSVRYLSDEYFGTDPLKRVPSADDVAALAWSAAQKSLSDPNGLAKLLDIVVKVKGYATKPADNPASSAPPSDEQQAEEDLALLSDLEKRIDPRGSETEVQERPVLPV